MGRRLDDTIRTNRKKLLAFVRRRIDDADEAEDLLQDVFLKASENLDALAPVSDILAWLWRALRNRVVDYYRSREVRRKHEILPDAHGGEEPGPDLDQLLTDCCPDAEDDFLRGEIAEALFESLDELPEAQREVLLLQEVEGFTFAEVAELTGVSINTLTARKRYAVRFLKKRLTEIRKVLEENRY